MIDLFNAVFHSFWTFSGTVIILGIICGSFHGFFK